MLGEYDESEEQNFPGEYYGEAADEDEEAAEDVAAQDDDDSLPPSVPEEDKELLFLIEFLVDSLHLRPDALARQRLDPCVLQGQHCISLTFLHFPPMSLCETDVDTDKAVGAEKTVFNAGKSLFFALTESRFEESPPVILQVAAYKEMPHGYPIPRMQLGKTKIDLSELFKMVLDKYGEKPDELPLAKSIQDSYTMTSDGIETADVDMYIRLSCLGQNIVTEFQKSDGICEPFLFKNVESKTVYECRSRGREDGFSDTKLRCELQSNQEPDSDDENYEEIFAEINGSALTVAVEKSRRKDKKKPYRIEDFCDCDIPLPPNLVEGISELSVTPMATGKKEIPDGGVGKFNNKIIFQIPPCEKLAKADGRNGVSYKVKTCKDGEEHGHKGKPCFRIITNEVVDKPTLPNDPEKDVFVLKIIKRGKCEKGRNAVELEFRTPKEKIVPPPKPPYMIEMGVGPEKKKEKKNKKKK